MASCNKINYTLTSCNIICIILFVFLGNYFYFGMAAQSKQCDLSLMRQHLRLQHVLRHLHPQQQPYNFISHAATNNESLPTTNNSTTTAAAPHTSVTTDTWNNVLGLLLLSQLVYIFQMHHLFFKRSLQANCSPFFVMP